MNITWTQGIVQTKPDSFWMPPQADVLCGSITIAVNPRVPNDFKMDYHYELNK